MFDVGWLLSVINGYKQRENKKKMKTENTATTGCQGKLMYFMSFPWPPVKAALSIFNVFLLLQIFYKELLRTKEIAIYAELKVSKMSILERSVQ